MNPKMNPNGMMNNVSPSAYSRMHANGSPGTHPRMSPHGNNANPVMNGGGRPNANGQYDTGYNAPAQQESGNRYDADYYAEYGASSQPKYNGANGDGYGSQNKPDYGSKGGAAYGASDYQGYGSRTGNDYGYDSNADNTGVNSKYNADYYSDYTASNDYGNNGGDYSSNQAKAQENGYAANDYNNGYGGSGYGETDKPAYNAPYTPASTEYGNYQANDAENSYSNPYAQELPKQKNGNAMASSYQQRPQNGQYNSSQAGDRSNAQAYGTQTPTTSLNNRTNSPNSYAEQTNSPYGNGAVDYYEGTATATAQVYAQGSAKVISTGSSTSTMKPPVEQDSQPQPQQEDGQNPAVHSEVDAHRMLQEQKKLDLERLQKQLETLPPKAKKPVLEKLAIFGAKAKKPIPSQPNTPSTVNTTVFSPTMSRGSSVETSPPDVLPNGSDELPITNAAVNDGSFASANTAKRYVTVKCASSSITLPVTAETTSTDILWAAAKGFRQHVSPATCILMECFVGLGVERRVRRYELISDIMNSWERDSENSLLIKPSGSGQSDFDLDVGAVSRSSEGPSGFNLQFYHATNPAKWAKRWLSLRRDGALVAGKREDFNASDRDVAPLCTLSDFDIYYPKESELRQIRPPKHYCYVVKSQQRRSQFPESGGNYIHFICTDDEAIARRFHEALHGWRSWWLVNQHLKLEQKPSTSTANNTMAAKPMNAYGTVARKQEPVIEERCFDVGNLDLSGIDIFAPKKEPPREELLSATTSNSMGQKYSPLVPPAPPPASAYDTDAYGAGGGATNPASVGVRYADIQPGVSHRIEKANSNAKSKKSAGFSLGGLLGSKSKNKSEEEEAEIEESSFVVHVPPPPPVIELPPPPPPEPESWFPSATAHSASTRSQSAQPVIHVAHKVIISDTPAEVAAGAWINFDELLADDPPVRPAVSEFTSILDAQSPLSAPPTAPYNQNAAYDCNNAVPNRRHSPTADHYNSSMLQPGGRDHHIQAYQHRGNYSHPRPPQSHQQHPQQPHPQHPHAQQQQHRQQQQQQQYHHHAQHHAQGHHDNGQYATAQEPHAVTSPMGMRQRSKSAANVPPNAAAMRARAAQVERPPVPNMPADSYMSAPVNNPFTRGRDRRPR